MFGSKPEVKKEVTISRQQQKVSDKLGQYLLGKVGTGGEMYQGQIVPGLIPQMSQGLGMVEGYQPDIFDQQILGALSRASSGSPAFDVSDAATQGRFQSGVMTPMLRTFDQDIAPRINEAFAARGALFSSRLADAKTRALGDMMSQGQQTLASWQQQNQALGASLADSAANRQLQGAQGLQQFSMAPLTRTMALSQALAPYQTRTDTQSQAEYQNWLRALPENSPWNQQAMSYLGTPYYALYGYQPQTPNIGGAAGGILGGLLMGSTMGLGGLGMLGAAGLGGMAGAF